VSEAAVKLEIAGEELIAHPERALIWPAAQTAFIADLHLGKGEIFRRSGIPIPEGSTLTDLARIASLIVEFDLQRIVLLGDFLHGPSSGASTHAKMFREWRTMRDSLEFIVVAGNHDRRAAGRELVDAVDWQTEGYELGPFACCHHPCEVESRFVLSGHLHPVVFLHGSHRERLRMPVLWLQSHCAVLPSFGSFTGGALIEPSQGDRLYAMAAGRVWKLP
jgi:DNA ligase-associated metallophosphoesterase